MILPPGKGAGVLREKNLEMDPTSYKYYCIFDIYVFIQIAGICWRLILWCVCVVCVRKRKRERGMGGNRVLLRQMGQWDDNDSRSLESWNMVPASSLTCMGLSPFPHFPKVKLSPRKAQWKWVGLAFLQPDTWIRKQLEHKGNYWQSVSGQNIQIEKHYL